MAIKFDSSAKANIDSVMGSGTHVDSILTNGDKANPKGIKQTKDVLIEAVTFISGLGTGYDEIDSSGTRTTLANSFEDLVHSVDTAFLASHANFHLSGADSISTPQLMVSAIDVELALVDHLRQISLDASISKGNRDKARRLAVDLAKKVAIDYRNLCAIVNPAGGTPVFEETIPGTSVNVMTSAPTGENLYQIYNYVNTNYAAIRANSGATMLLDPDITAKTLPKDSIKSPGVRAKDLGRRIYSGKGAPQEYKELFGGLYRKEKITRLVINIAVPAVVVAGIITGVVASFWPDKEPESTTGVEDTMAPEDTAINNPALDGVETEKAPATNADGENVTQPANPDINDYDEPSEGRNEDAGYSEDFVNPNEEDVIIPDEPEEDEPEVEPEEQVETSEEEEFDEDEPAGRF